MLAETDLPKSQPAFLKFFQKMKEKIDGGRSLATLNIRGLIKLLEQHFGRGVRDDYSQSDSSKQHGRLVFGLRGIQDLFGCSHKQAQYYKDHVIREAVSQNGRKIVVDADLALKLFRERRAER